MLGGLSPAHLLIIMVIALIVVGPGKLPEVGAAIGRSLREFQKATGGITESLTGAMTQQTPPSQAAAQPPAQPGYPAPASQPQPGYPAPAQPVPMQYYPVMGVVEPAPVAPAQPAPAGYPQPDPSVQQPPSPPTAR